MEIFINWWAVLVSAIVAMVIGSVWYGPLFGKKYISAKGMDKMSPEEQAAANKGMYFMYLWQFVASLVTFTVLAWFIGVLGNFTALGGMEVAFWVWLGFVVPMKFSNELWGGKMTLFWIGAPEALVTLLVAGTIIGAW